MLRVSKVEMGICKKFEERENRGRSNRRSNLESKTPTGVDFIDAFKDIDMELYIRLSNK